MKKVIPFTVLAMLFTSCREDAFVGLPVEYYFHSPQPDEVSELKNFPDEFIGKYTLGDSVLIITKNAIYSEIPTVISEHKDILKDSVKQKISYRNGQLTTEGITFSVVEKNDSLYLSTKFTDTLFVLSKSQRAKQVDNNLILSHSDSIFWKVNILTFIKDSLKWRHLSSKEDYRELKIVVKNSKANVDTTVVKLKPTNREFRILSMNKMGWEKGYKKVR
ncbi:MAG: hypothetical protein EOO45_14485 [Flavobacterium sp.]|nr:MAG: hypothetical protein EOO45_14485 [Flavobacterium sp.]